MKIRKKYLKTILKSMIMDLTKEKGKYFIFPREAKHARAIVTNGTNSIYTYLGLLNDLKVNYLKSGTGRFNWSVKNIIWKNLTEITVHLNRDSNKELLNYISNLFHQHIGLAMDFKVQRMKGSEIVRAYCINEALGMELLEYQNLASSFKTVYSK